MKSLTFIFCTLALALCSFQFAFAQFEDRDYDGVPDSGGQDKCPSTLTQIQGRLATAIDEKTGKEINCYLPDDLSKYVKQERTPLVKEQTKWRNKMGNIKRERNRVDTKYGKYADMSGKERKELIAKLDEEIATHQAQIDSLATKIKSVNPNSYFEFIANIEDKDGKIIEQNVMVIIRLSVDIFGCLPDKDRDGAPDMVDKCPDFVGTVESSGCPDRDKDGIPDMSDECPDVKGPKESKGCPDRDKDKVPDYKDDCPDVKGEIDLKGCPDRDKDGIVDKDDDCPDEKGVPELKGCPDRDGDGIKDKDDKCPDQPGPKETQGCPDRDKDGVVDNIDECPDVPGPADNKGCPKILERASKVLFETGKSIIKPLSYPLLNELVSLLKEYPDANIDLAGHTDSEGDDEANLQLSKDRAAAVRQYLIDKGIAADRVTSTGYGETKPIATNDTADGKSKNRRVEMKLSNKK